MDKQLLLRLANGQKASLEDLNSFVSSYVEERKGTPPTVEQLSGIVHFIQRGIFSLEYALKYACEEHGITMTAIKDESGNVLKYEAYETISD